MTTGENIDNENITITSDEAFERVTSDESFTDEQSKGYLQQNTSGLVQEIPNISFLDIADTMLESKKTLYKRENWILRVGEKGRSIEVQPQDTVTLLMNASYDINESGEHYIEFDKSLSSLNYTVCAPQQTGNLYRVNILQSGYYIISYGWEVKPNSASNLRITVKKNGTTIIISDGHKDTQLPEIMSGGRYLPNVYLEKGDVVDMYILCDSSVTINKDTYLSIQFQQYSGYSNI